MKHFVTPVICIILVMSCAVTNRIVVTDDSQMKTLKLTQLPEAIISKEDGLSTPADLDITSIYLCEEIKYIRPQVTVNIQISESMDYQLSVASIVIVLDNENIELNSLNYAAEIAKDTISLVNKIDTVYQNERLPTDTTVNSKRGKVKQSFVIPENLWVSIINTNIVKYKITTIDDKIEITLNQSEKSMLDKFLGMAIKNRDTRFPAVPEGQKKW